MTRRGRHNPDVASRSVSHFGSPGSGGRAARLQPLVFFLCSFVCLVVLKPLVMLINYHLIIFTRPSQSICPAKSRVVTNVGARLVFRVRWSEARVVNELGKL